MWVRDSDLQVTPTAYYVLHRTYEPLDEVTPLVVVGLDPAILNPVPSELSQLKALDSPQFRAEVEREYPDAGTVLVSRGEPNFSLTATQREDGSNKFSFVTTGRASFSFSCREDAPATCAAVLDMYAAKLVEIRTAATKRGLAQTREVIETLQGMAETSDTSVRDRLSAQISALDLASARISGEMVLVTESEEFEGVTITTVENRSFLFGSAIGLLIGLLILVQFALSDRKIRGRGKVIRRFGDRSVVASVDPSIPTSIEHAVAAIEARAHEAQLTQVQLIPIAPRGMGELAVSLASRASSVRILDSAHVDSLDASRLRDLRGGAALLVVARHRDQLDDLVRTWTVLESSGISVLGVILVERRSVGSR
jgi:hypothetical protein